MDGIFFDPTGTFLFMSNRSPAFRLTIVNAAGLLVQHAPMASEPDGIAFHALAPKFVVTNNTNGTITRFDFPADDFTQVPVQSVFASGGFRGDLSQVGPDGCFYVTQNGTRYNNLTVTGQNSLVRICGGFAPPPGVKDNTTPDCQLTAVIAGPPKQLQITAQDTGSGISTITVLTATNVTVSIPPFAVGTTSPVVVTATKINQALSSTVRLEVKDVANNVTVCDPVFTLVVREEGKPVTQTFTGLPQAESKVKIVNGDPGLAKLNITVNGKKFKEKDLADNVTQTIDVSSAMAPGNNNTITLEARGKPGGSATVVISD